MKKTLKINVGIFYFIVRNIRYKIRAELHEDMDNGVTFNFLLKIICFNVMIIVNKLKIEMSIS
jgi:hypothetical protein